MLFLTAEGVSGSAAVCGEYSISHARVFEWNKPYREGRVSLKDSSRPGQAYRVIAEVDVAVREDRRGRHSAHVEH